MILITKPGNLSTVQRTHTLTRVTCEHGRWNGAHGRAMSHYT